MISTAVTWLCCASSVAIDRPTYPVPATAIFNGEGDAIFSELLFVNNSVISKSNTSPRFSNCSIEGTKSCCSMREISARLIPVASPSCAWVIDFCFRSLTTVSARRDGDSFFIIGLLLFV